MRYVDFFLQFLGGPGAGSRERILFFGAGICLAAALAVCTYALVRWRRNRVDAAFDDEEPADDGDAYDPAVAEFDQALAADPLAVDKRRERGLHYFQKGEYDLAMQDFHVWVAQAPKSADAYRHRGDAWCKLGFNDLAIADYRFALRLEPSNTAAREGFKALVPPPADRPARGAPSMPSLTALFANQLHVDRPIPSQAVAKAPHGPEQEAR